MEMTIYIASGGLILAILMALWRMAKGPTVLDRILCFDAIVVCIVGLIILLSIQWDTTFFLELILVVSLLGFISGVAFVFYLEKTLDVEDEVAEEAVREARGNSSGEEGQG